MTATRYLLYGAYGFTGRRIARRAVELGDRPVLAGRDRPRLESLAAELGLDHVVLGLDETGRLQGVLEEVPAVLNAAGPFAHTYRPMAEACISTGTHYLDITGEIEVIEGLHGMGGAAEAAGVALLPGVGFDVVPTDCAAAIAAGAVEGATRLDLAFHSTGGPSRGTARTMVEGLDAPQLERRGGRIVPVDRPGPVRIPFSDHLRNAIPVSWGDVASAYHSTGIPDVRVHMTASAGLVRWTGIVRRTRPIVRLGAVRWLLRAIVDRVAEGPSERELARGRSRVWCRARDETTGDEATVELVTPNGYTLTARSAAAAVRRLLEGRAPDDEARPRVGFLTPSLAFGASFAETLEGVERSGPVHGRGDAIGRPES